MMAFLIFTRKYRENMSVIQKFIFIANFLVLKTVDVKNTL